MHHINHFNIDIGVKVPSMKHKVSKMKTKAHNIESILRSNSSPNTNVTLD